MASTRRLARAVGLGVLVLALIAGTAFAVLRLEFEGPSLGDTLASLLNKRMRGRISIGSVEWASRDLKKLVTGGWVPLRVTRVKVWDDCALSAGAGTSGAEFRTTDPNEDCTPDDHPDPDPTSKRIPRKLLIDAPEITAELDVHALLFGNHDYVFRHVVVRGGEALLEQTREPYPLHAYDRTIMSIISAFYPRMKAGFRAGIYADAPPPVFDLRDITVEHLGLTAHLSPGGGRVPGNVQYSTTLRLEDVSLHAVPRADGEPSPSFVFYDAIDPLVAKFYVRLAMTSPRGTLQINDDGPRSAFEIPAPGAPYPPAARHAKYTLHLVDIKLDRLAQLPTEWARHDLVANTLELALSAKTVPCAPDEGPPRDYTRATPDGAELVLTGDLEKYFDRPYDGQWDLRLDGKNMGPTVRSCIKGKIGGDDLGGTLTLTGPFAASPKLTADLKNLDVDIPIKRGTDPIRLTLAEVHGGIDLVDEQGYIEKTKALVRGGKEPGELAVGATFGWRPYNANAVIEIPKAIDVGRFLPESIRTSVGRYVVGRLSAKGDVDEGFALEDFDLALGPTPTQKAIRAYHGRLFTPNNFATIQIDKVDIEAGASRARFDGSVDTKTDQIDVTIDGNFPDLDVWMKRFGLPALFKSAGGGVIHITGKITDPRIEASTTLAGVPCIETLRLDNVTIQDKVIDVRSMSSPGLGGRLAGTARIRLGAGGAPPTIERMHLTGTNLDAARLCGLKGKVTGQLDAVEVDLHGTVDKTRRPMDWLALASGSARAKELAIVGDRYRDVAACVNQPADKETTACRPRGATYLDSVDRATCDDAKRQTGAGGFCAVASATRATGGALDATIARVPATTTGKQKVPTHLAGTIALSELPLAIVDQFARGKLEGADPGAPLFGGTAGAVIHLSGPPDAPRATGGLDLVRAWVGKAFVGDARIEVNPVTLPPSMPGANRDGVQLHGTLLAGRVELDGTLGTAPPYPVELVLRGHAIEVDPFIDLGARLGIAEPVRAWASGTISVKTELAPLANKPASPEAWVELSELRVIVDHKNPDGRLQPIVLAAAAPSTPVPGDRPAMGNAAKDPDLPGRPAVSVRATPTTVELACRDAKTAIGKTPCPTKLEVRVLGAAAPAVMLALRGQLTPGLVDFTADGQLALANLQALVDTRFDAVAGTARLTAALVGSPRAPKLEASADLDHVLLRPVGGDTILEAPGGQIKLANSSLAFAGLVVNVRDEHRDDSQGQLEVHGGIALDGVTPTTWGVFVTGQVAGKLLTVVAPNAISQASGVATIGDDALRLWGHGPRPLIAGSLEFDARAPVTILPRGVRREVSLARGTIEITTCGGNLAAADQDPDCAGPATAVYGDHRAYRLAISDIGGKIDNEGILSSLSGAVVLRDRELAAVDVTLDADSIPFRVPGSLDLVLALRGLGVSYANDRWRATGAVTLVSGTYKTNFDLADRITKIAQAAPAGRPFWEVLPGLASADLHLVLDVRKFTVDNNIATIDMSGKDIEITQTPRDPRLSGSITVQQGRFRIPGTRADFTNTRGTVDFAENQRATNPRLDVTSEANYRDLSGQEHIITMTISGSLDQPQWDLHTSTGYNKSQTLSLLVLGRNQEQLRRSLGDQSLGTDPLHIDPTTNPTAGFADQIVKDLAGDWVSSLIGSSLTKLTGLDVLRFDIGFGSVGVHAEKRLFEMVRVIGDGETTIRGSTKIFTAELKTPFRGNGHVTFTLQGGYLSKDYVDPAEQDIVDVSARFVFRLFIP